MCGRNCSREEAHNGLAMLYGPWGCYCGWSEDGRYDRSAGQAGIVDGGIIDQWGMMTRREGLTTVKLFATHRYCLIAKCANDNVLFMRAPDALLVNMDGPFLNDNIRGMPSAVFPFVNGVYSVTVEEWG